MSKCAVIVFEIETSVQEEEDYRLLLLVLDWAPTRSTNTADHFSILTSLFTTHALPSNHDTYRFYPNTTNSNSSNENEKEKEKK